MDDPVLQEQEAQTRGRVAPEYRMVATCEIEVPPPAALIIFGGTGDLSQRKLFPSLFRLFRNRMLAEHFFILGVGRVALTTDRYRETIRQAVTEDVSRDFDEAVWSNFISHVYYSRFDYADIASYSAGLARILPGYESAHQTQGNRIFYLAVPPFVFEQVIHNLGESGLSREENGCSHIVIEKPFGHDLQSARRLNELMLTHFQESQIFRIDHYLAKETVQSILMFRFANSIFEPLWDRRYVDHVQITASETLGVEGRGGYYEEAGVIRDMFQNHMYQLLCLTAMEPPALFVADRVQDDKTKVLRSLRSFQQTDIEQHIVVGQYEAGAIDGTPVPGYTGEEGVGRESGTPTYAAMRVFIDNWRWQGVPFYLRSGKRLARRKTEISVHFKGVPYSMFPESVGGPIEPNTIVLKIQPNEGMSLTFQTKQPGSKVCLTPVEMTYAYPRGVLLDAYEWVLLDCMLGDRMLFMRNDSVELAWSKLTPLLEAVDSGTGPPLAYYASGSEGPDGARRLIEQDGRFWRPL